MKANCYWFATIYLLVGSSIVLAGDREVREIQAAGKAFSAALVAGDMQALGNAYVEDAVILPPGARIVGRDAIKKYFAPKPGVEMVSHTLTMEDVDINYRMAVDVGTWQSSWRKTGAKGEDAVQTASGRYMVVWRREKDRQWRMTYDMWQRNPVVQQEK